MLRVECLLFPWLFVCRLCCEHEMSSCSPRESLCSIQSVGGQTSRKWKTHTHTHQMNHINSNQIQMHLVHSIRSSDSRRRNRKITVPFSHMWWNVCNTLQSQFFFIWCERIDSIILARLASAVAIQVCDGALRMGSMICVRYVSHRHRHCQTPPSTLPNAMLCICR